MSNLSDQPTKLKMNRIVAEGIALIATRVVITYGRDTARGRTLFAIVLWVMLVVLTHAQTPTVPTANKQRVPLEIAADIRRRAEIEMQEPCNTDAKCAMLLNVRQVQLRLIPMPGLSFYFVELTHSQCGSAGCPLFVYQFDGVSRTATVLHSGLDGGLGALRVLKTTHHGLYDVCYEKSNATGDTFVSLLYAIGQAYESRDLSTRTCD